MKEKEYKSYWQDKTEEIKEGLVKMFVAIGFILFFLVWPVTFGFLIMELTSNSLPYGILAGWGMMSFNVCLFIILKDYAEWKHTKKQKEKISVEGK